MRCFLVSQLEVVQLREQCLTASTGVSYCFIVSVCSQTSHGPCESLIEIT